MNIKFQILPDYQKSQFVEGVEVQSQYNLELNISTLQREERQFILDTYYKDKELSDFSLELTVPSYDPVSNSRTYKPWMAKVNPEAIGVQGAVQQWMDDFEAEEEKTTAEYNQH